MLKIAEDFFREEERMEFIIPEAMKRLWAVQLNLLDALLGIAHKHGIRFWVEYGTLLGAVRHGGYVPWDDDIDICIMRKDYMKFVHILNDELPDYCKVYSFYTLEDYDQPKAYICNREHIDIGYDPKEADITRLMYGCPYASGIDMNPLDYVPSDPEQWKLIGQIYMSLYDLANNYDTYQAGGEAEGYVSQIENLLNTKIARDEHIKTSIWKLADAVAMMTERREADRVVWYGEFAMGGYERVKKLSDYESTVYMDFEMLKVPVPSGYDNLLRSDYGENYMTPIKGRAGHEYPFYKVQDRIILHNHRFSQQGDVF
jgi:lipopolysaccharide cholinephosphotransferase